VEEGAICGCDDAYGSSRSHHREVREIWEDDFTGDQGDKGDEPISLISPISLCSYCTSRRVEEGAICGCDDASGSSRSDHREVREIWEDDFTGRSREIKETSPSPDLPDLPCALNAPHAVP
jgi:hypothetical protein